MPAANSRTVAVRAVSGARSASSSSSLRMLCAHVLGEVLRPFEGLPAYSTVVRTLLGMRGKVSLQFMSAGTFSAANVTQSLELRSAAQAPPEGLYVQLPGGIR